MCKDKNVRSGKFNKFCGICLVEQVPFYLDKHCIETYKIPPKREFIIVYNTKE